jgi:hypothetical protein
MSLDFKNIRNMILGLVSARGLQLLQALCFAVAVLVHGMDITSVYLVACVVEVNHFF